MTTRCVFIARNCRHYHIAALLPPPLPPPLPPSTTYGSATDVPVTVTVVYVCNNVVAHKAAVVVNVIYITLDLI